MPAQPEHDDDHHLQETCVRQCWQLQEWAANFIKVQNANNRMPNGDNRFAILRLCVAPTPVFAPGWLLISVASALFLLFACAMDGPVGMVGGMNESWG